MAGRLHHGREIRDVFDTARGHRGRLELVGHDVQKVRRLEACRRGVPGGGEAGVIFYSRRFLQFRCVRRGLCCPVLCWCFAVVCCSCAVTTLCRAVVCCCCAVATLLRLLRCFYGPTENARTHAFTHTCPHTSTRTNLGALFCSPHATLSLARS